MCCLALLDTKLNGQNLWSLDHWKMANGKLKGSK